jgi:uncharacterized protein YjbJ (UPF0337 family)
MTLNVQGLQGRWNYLKGELKKRWGQLTDDDLRWTEGNIDQLIGRIQERTGETRDAIENYLGQFASEGRATVSSAVESAGAYAQEVSHRLRDRYGALSQQAQESFYTARDYISRNPMGWIAIAFGVGVLTGVLVSGGISYSSESSRRRIF